MCFKKSVLFLISVLLMTGVNMKAQKDVTSFLQMGITDAKIMSEAYLRPYGEMLGKSLNGGWYNSAGVHNLGGFDITFGVNMSMVPASGENFDINTLGLSEGWSLEDPNNHIAPTIAGEMQEDSRPYLQLGEESVLRAPNGTGFNKFPIPMVQASVGLPFHSEVSLRFIPNSSLGDAGKVNLYGFGIKHSIKEYLPFMKRAPFLRTSVILGYTKMASEVGVTNYGEGFDQSLDISSSAFTSRFLVGVNIPVLSVYTGVGYGSTNSDFALKGDFGSLGTDPFIIGYTTSGLDFNAGMRLRFGIFALHADYTVGDYSMVSGGIGISFR